VPAFSDLERFPFWVGFAILFVAGWISIVVATLLTKPEPLSVLEDFYCAARPVGLWGPVRRSLAARGLEPRKTELGQDIATSAWGILFYFFLCVGLFSIMGGRSLSACGEFTVAAVSGYFFARKAMVRFSVSSR
jgi:hypothetical protein